MPLISIHPQTAQPVHAKHLTDYKSIVTNTISQNNDLRQSNASIIASFVEYKTRTEESRLNAQEAIIAKDEQISTLNSIITQHEQTISQYCTDMKAMQLQRIKDADQFTKYRERIKQLEDELVMTKKETIKQVQKPPKSMQMSLHELQTSKIIKLQVENKELQSKLTKAYKDISSSQEYEKTVSELLNDNTLLKEELAQTQNELKNIKQKYTQLHEKYNKTKSKANNAQPPCHSKLSCLPSRYRTLTLEESIPLAQPGLLSNKNNSIDVYFSLASARSCQSIEKQAQLEELRKNLRSSANVCLKPQPACHRNISVSVNGKK